MTIYLCFNGIQPVPFVIFSNNQNLAEMQSPILFLVTFILVIIAWVLIKKLRKVILFEVSYSTYIGYFVIVVRSKFQTLRRRIGSRCAEGKSFYSNSFPLGGTWCPVSFYSVWRSHLANPGCSRTSKYPRDWCASRSFRRFCCGRRVSVVRYCGSCCSYCWWVELRRWV